MLIILLFLATTMAFDFVCLTTFQANKPVESWFGVSFFFVGTIRCFLSRLESSRSWPKLPPPIVFIENSGDKYFLRLKTRRFFFLENIFNEPTSKEGATMISKNILSIFLAKSTVHFLFIATTPPKADKLSTLSALEKASPTLFPTPTPQGELCFTITQAGDFLNSDRHCKAASPSKKLLYERALPWCCLACGTPREEGVSPFTTKAFWWGFSP